MEINPIRLIGNWDEGWALDKHMVKSNHIGYNEYGHPVFDTVRTEIGELVYQLKYNKNSKCLEEIVEFAVNFLNSRGIINNVDIIIPAPPSKNRVLQPVFEIASAIAEFYEKGYYDDILIKTTNEESKDIDRTNKNLTGSIIATKRVEYKYNVLIIDDLYSTGETLKECVRVLRDDYNIGKIYVLTMTKTR